MSFKVLIPQDITDCGKDFLKEKGYEIKMGSGITVEQIKKDVEDCDAILARTAPFPKEVLEAGKKLKVIGRHGVGVDNIDCNAAEEMGIYVTNAPESNASSVAEHAIGFIVCCARNMVRNDKAFRAGDFEIRNRLKGFDLAGKTLSIIGLGRIGKMVAKKAMYGLDMKVIAYDPYVKKEDIDNEIDLTDNWEYAFKNADFVTLHLPALESTKGIVGKKEFDLMKDTAYLINVARGEVLNEGELIEALKEEKINGAAIDVFDPEPPAKDSKLFQLDNIILTPHNAALTYEAMDRMGLHAAMGIDDVLNGRKPKWPVNNPKR